jgi:hypothetical protein
MFKGELVAVKTLRDYFSYRSVEFIREAHMPVNRGFHENVIRPVGYHPAVPLLCLGTI